MTKQLLTVDGFRSSAKDGDRPDAMVVCAMAGEPEPVADTRRVKFVFSDGSVDRAGDTIDPNGWVLDNYKKNPVALFGHDSLNIDSVIGRTVNVGTVGNKLVGEIEFADADVNPKADMAYRMVEAGLLSAVSVGFLPLDYAFTSDKGRPYGIDFSKQELLEVSLCPVPCNGNALVTARSLGIDTAPLAEWAERVLDGDGKVPVPRTFLEQVFRAAKTPKSVRQRYLSPEAKPETSDWKVGAATDLPMADGCDDAWDAPAVKERLLSAAGFDGDSPDYAKARSGFLIYDAANPALKASYKLPFADIIDGILKAVPGGMSPSTERLAKTDAPQSTIEDARKVLGSYESIISKAARTKNAFALLQKDLNDVGWLASLLQSLSSLQHWVEWETELEGDDSAIPDRLAAVLTELGQILLDMTAEEIAELLGGEAGGGLDMVMMSAKTRGQRALVALAGMVREKAGRTISAANVAKLQKAMEHHQNASDCVKSVLDANAEAEGSEDPADPVLEPMDGTKEADELAAKAASERERRMRHANALKLATEVL